MLRIFFSCLFLLLGLTSVCQAEGNRPRELSLNEAILLATRQNPNVQGIQLSHVLAKFELEIQQWQFQPHYSFEAKRQTSHDYTVTKNDYVTENTTGFGPTATLLTPFGTDVKLAATNNMGKNYNPGLSLTVMQPLIRGFGRPIVEAALYEARDSEKITRLRVEIALRETVNAVINAYLDVVSAENRLMIDQKALERAHKTEDQTKLFIKAGHKAGVELVTVQAAVANTERSIEDDRNSLDQSRYALLSIIGIDPNTQVSFSNVDVPQLIKKYDIPSLDDSKQMSLNNDLQYQIDQITFNGTTKRSVLLAEDKNRWQLNLTLTAATGGGTGGGPNAGINSLVNGINQKNSATLDLIIPIDDRSAKADVTKARIALRQAEIELQRKKWEQETKIITVWRNIYSAERSLRLAEHAKQLELKSYGNNSQKYSYGLIDSLMLQSARQNLNSAEQNLINSRIGYLKSLVNLDLLVGRTLQTWDVKVRYS